jgi:hypothetical protein
LKPLPEWKHPSSTVKCPFQVDGRTFLEADMKTMKKKTGWPFGGL